MHFCIIINPPHHRHSCRGQAENPHIQLSDFPRPSLPATSFRNSGAETSMGQRDTMMRSLCL
jgi:hypothetical protein